MALLPNLPGMSPITDMEVQRAEEFGSTYPKQHELTGGGIREAEELMKEPFDPATNEKDQKSLSDATEVADAMLKLPEEQRQKEWSKLASLLINDNPKVATIIDINQVPDDDQLKQVLNMEGKTLFPIGENKGAKIISDDPGATEAFLKGSTAAAKGAPEFKIPSGYRLVNPENPGLGLEPIPGSGVDTATPEKAAKQQMMRTAKEAVPIVKELLFNKDGSINRKNIFTMDVPLVPGDKGIPWTDGKKLRTAMEFGIQAITRGETGAAMPPSEVDNTRERFQPSIWDNDETIKLKLEMYEKFINGSIHLMDPTGKFSHDRFNNEKAKIKQESWMKRAKELNPNMTDDEIKSHWEQKNR